ncbi:enoyl-CoA hydratase/isomerase family protein [Janibacter sp. HTCC2649]|uniref:enoyl-CoA hydratase/isomerase family protein n=1 Tax=Janibacter sp. HTCC2649 TaxID=313589 RepID=UPI000321EB2C|nr:enoyl-CoA hydratase/isomerase family protein [Janibacter sp. HTCC2649]
MALRVLSVDELVQGGAGLGLNSSGRPEDSLLAVDLDGVGPEYPAGPLARAAQALNHPHVPVVGFAARPLSGPAGVLARAFDTTLVARAADLGDRATVACDDVDQALDRLALSVAARPITATTLCQVVRLAPALNVADGLVVESLAYSMLLASPEFWDWRATTPRRELPPDSGHAGDLVAMTRDGDLLDVVLNNPNRRNAYSRRMRDGLLEALELTALDPTLREVTLSGAGPSFCSGGDLDEFGTIDDVSAAHLIRLRQGTGAALEKVRDRVSARLHGACIGAGIEIPAFAAVVAAHADTTFRLPELAMGLIPGAGGTVSITRRIGPWRTTWLALSGEAIGADVALAWGLVDAVH